MTLQDIRDNLITTIESKKVLLGEYEDTLKKPYYDKNSLSYVAVYSCTKFLEINLKELNNILDHINAVINDQENDRIERDLNT